MRKFQLFKSSFQGLTQKGTPAEISSSAENSKKKIVRNSISCTIQQLNCVQIPHQHRLTIYYDLNRQLAIGNCAEASDRTSAISGS